MESDLSWLLLFRLLVYIKCPPLFIINDGGDDTMPNPSRSLDLLFSHFHNIRNERRIFLHKTPKHPR